MKHLNFGLVSGLFLAAVVVSGCKNPADDKPQAQVAAAVQSAAAERPAAGASTYQFSNADSKLAFVGSKVTGSHDGSINSFKGTVTIPDGAIEKGRVTVDADAQSISSDNEKLTGHLKSADFFDVAKYPRIHFESTSVQPSNQAGATHLLTGNMEMHGVTKSITFPAKVSVQGDTVKVNAEFSINRKDFGINYAGKADDLIRDEVVVKLDINAKKAG